MSRAPGSIHRQRDFASLSGSRARGRSGPLRVVRASIDPTGPEHEPVEVGYAIGRSVGTAVVRNRLRRRLRALMRTCLDDETLSPGRYLVSVGPGAVGLPFDELDQHLRAALAQLP